MKGELGGEGGGTDGKIHSEASFTSFDTPGLTCIGSLERTAFTLHTYFRSAIHALALLAGCQVYIELAIHVFAGRGLGEI